MVYQADVCRVLSLIALPGLPLDDLSDGIGTAVLPLQLVMPVQLEASGWEGVDAPENLVHTVVFLHSVILYTTRGLAKLTSLECMRGLVHLSNRCVDFQQQLVMSGRCLLSVAPCER